MMLSNVCLHQHGSISMTLHHTEQMTYIKESLQDAKFLSLQADSVFKGKGRGGEMTS